MEDWLTHSDGITSGNFADPMKQLRDILECAADDVNSTYARIIHYTDETSWCPVECVDLIMELRKVEMEIFRLGKEYAGEDNG